jgi:hypothetical protein
MDPDPSRSLGPVQTSIVPDSAFSILAPAGTNPDAHFRLRAQ